MATATNAQVQAFVDQRLRPRCEAARALALAMVDDIAAITDVYANVSAGSPTWADSRTDGPPHLLVPNDVLAFNSFIHDISTAISGNAQYAIVLESCVRPVTG
jgi:hypothetical protein